MDRRNVPAARKRRRGRNGARLGIEIIFKLFGFCVMCCAVFSFVPAEKTELYLHTYGNLGIIFLYYSAVWCDV